MEHIGDMTVKSELGYVLTVSIYRSQNCTGCPMRGQCYKADADKRTIEVNHRNNAYRRKVKELLTSERGLYHRSNRPIETEAVFGNIKSNYGFKRFLLKSYRNARAEFGLIPLAHNIRKYIALSNVEKGVEI